MNSLYGVFHSPVQTAESLKAQLPAQFLRGLHFTLKWEGGISHDRHDPGNRGGYSTAFGITQQTYDNWRTEKGVPKQSNLSITPGEVLQLYYERYYRPFESSQLSPKVAIVLFDTAVNVGTEQTTKFLQRSLHLSADGILGSRTLSRIGLVNQDLLVNRILNQRDSFYKTLAEKPTYQRYLRGWLNRTSDLRRYAQGFPLASP